MQEHHPLEKWACNGGEVDGTTVSLSRPKSEKLMKVVAYYEHPVGNRATLVRWKSTPVPSWGRRFKSSREH